MKKFQKMLALIMAVCMVCALSVTVFAVESDEPTPYYIPCSGGGKHPMVSHGKGYVYSGGTTSSLLFQGSCTQCSQCNLVVISSQNPYLDRLIGVYTLVQPKSTLTTTMNYFFNESIGGEYYGSMSADSFWSGFSFMGA